MIFVNKSIISMGGKKQSILNELIMVMHKLKVNGILTGDEIKKCCDIATNGKEKEQ